MDNEIVTAPVFLGLARPATILGISLIAFVCEAEFVAITLIAFKSLIPILAAPVCHLVLYGLSYKDPGIFDDIKLFITTGGLMSKSVKKWGSRSFAPVKGGKYVNRT